MVDVKPSTKYTPRVAGPPKDVPLPKTNTLDGRVRRWQVDVPWLDENRDQDTPRTLADNGRLWGDVLDPEEIEDQKQTTKDKKKGIAAIKREAEERSDAPRPSKKARGKRKAATVAPSSPVAGPSTSTGAGPSNVIDDELHFE